MLNLFKKISNRNSPKRRTPSTSLPLAFETLEKRELMALASLWFSGNRLVVKANNASTSIEINNSGSNLQIKDLYGNKTWNYSRSSVGSLEFQGGSGSDRFVNNISNLPVIAFGGSGNDYLEGYSANDTFVGGDGDDIIKGFSGNDSIWGGNGNDTVQGGSGNDSIRGESGNDRLEGGDGDDVIWGGYGDDTLLGGYGNDQLVGDSGNDQLNGQSGNDKMWGGDGNDVLVAIDNAFGDYLQSDAGNDTLWLDQSSSTRDSMYGNSSYDKIQSIGSFSNGADKTLDGDRLADPIMLSGYTKKAFDGPLFSTSGPKLDDVRQGALGDCYFLAGVGAIAMDSPLVVRQNMVDFNDGTFGVRYGNSFYRVDNDLPAKYKSTTPAFAGLGAQGSVWVAIAEKAYTYYRRGLGSYASIEGGWSVEVNRAWGSTSAGVKALDLFSSATAMANEIFSRWNTYQAVTVGFFGTTKTINGPLVTGHMYTVAQVYRDSAGNVTGIKLRNPWGVDGGSGTDSNPNDGYVTVTASQLFAYRSVGQINWGRV